MEMNFLKLEGYPILEQLQIEEALLRADDQNWCLLNRGSPDAIVMGISGIVEQLINPELFSQNPVPLIRRFSGGGTVYIDPNTLFLTFICNTPSFPDQVHSWVEALLSPLFPHCPFRFHQNDYTIGDRKVGGNAQYFRKNRWLHHTSLLWDFSPEKMYYLLPPPKMPLYRNERSHTDFLTTLSNHFPSLDTFQTNLETHLCHTLQLNRISLDTLTPILNRPHRKSTTLL